ncbi:MAG: EAL domain-containing protein [Gammaproteobacteria bacterium]|nr:EAL domain-containing protein [Gammaproteobacteria bacterium]
MNSELFQQSFDVVSSALLIVDGSGQIHAVNSAFIQLCAQGAYCSDDFVGEKLINHPHLPSSLIEAYQQLLGGEVSSLSSISVPVTDDGVKAWFNISLHSFSSSDSYIIVHENITDMIAITDLAEQATNMLDEIQEVMGFGWWNLDIKKQQAIWSKQVFSILGYDPDVDKPTPENFLSRIHPEDREKAITALEKPFTDHEPYSSEFRILLPDGTVRYISEHGNVIFDEHGNGERYLGTTLDVTKRVEAERKLIESEAELRKILDNMQDTYYRADENGYITRASPSVEQLLGYQSDEIIGTKITDIYINPDEREKLFKTLKENNGVVHGFEASLKHKDGSIVWVSTNAQVIKDGNGKSIGIEGTTRNITEKKAIYRQMRKLSQALEQSADSVTITNAEGEIEYANPACEKTTGYCIDEMLGKKSSILKSGEMENHFYEKLWDSITNGIAFSDTFINKKKDGTLFYEQKTISPLKNTHGEITHYVSTGRDITDFIQSQERIQFLAHHDALTGLPNRVLFQERLEHSVHRAKRRNSTLTILFFDLDRFKVINDTLGHYYGDLLLKELSKRLKQCIREEDTIARLGGDEFAVLIEDAMNIRHVSALANKILETVAIPIKIQKREVHITASIGISSYPHDGDQPEILLRNADVAMYRAKEMGRNNYAFYSSELSEKAVDRLKIETALRQALAKNEFVIFYQPQLDIYTGKVSGMEALIRWQSKEFGLVMPAEFVPVLEEIGLINKVGNWVIQTACRQLKQWQDSKDRDLSVSINLSSRQFNDASIVDIVGQAILINNLDPGLIGLEITESLLMRNVKSIDDTLERLSKLGLNIAIDDFGTGYSSLSYLKRFPINILKIDRSFIKDITFDGSCSDEIEIVRAIIAMSKSLKMKTVAEGVENQSQKDFLDENSCDLIQGYWLSKPLNVDEMTDWLDMQGMKQQVSRSETLM